MWPSKNALAKATAFGTHAHHLEEDSGIVCDQKDRSLLCARQRGKEIQIVITGAKGKLCVITTVALRDYEFDTNWSKRPSKTRSSSRIDSRRAFAASSSGP